VGLTVLVNFPDQTTNVTQSQVTQFLNNPGGINGATPGGSVYDYFYDVSNGRMNYTNIVTTFITLPKNKAYYDRGYENGAGLPNYQNGEGSPYLNEFFSDVFTALSALSIDISTITTETVGSRQVAVALNIFYAGSASAGWSAGLYPHFSVLPSSFSTYSKNGIGFSKYQIADLGTAAANLTIGTFVHESGHLVMGWDDLYPYDNTIADVVYTYCTMGAGASANPSNPPMPNPYYRDLAGWIDVTDINSTNATLTHNANSHTAYKYTRNDNESYYIEARKRIGRSAGLWGEGLIIWHTHKNGNNTGYVTNLNQNLNPFPQVKVVQANNPNSTAQPFVAFTGQNGAVTGNEPFQAGGGSNNTNFSSTSSPAARYFDGTLSDINISDVSALGDVMSFKIGTPTSTTPAVASVTVSPASVTLSLGATETFTATVTGTNSPLQSVIWSIEEIGIKVASGTSIDPSTGVLTIASNQMAGTLAVRATSAFDPSKSGIAMVSVVQRWDCGASNNVGGAGSVYATLAAGTLTISGRGNMANYNITPWVAYRNIITTVVIGNNITSIGDNAFSGCTGLTSVTIPGSVTSIGGDAFSGCTGLTSVTIPASVTSIGTYAFSGCTGLEAINVDADNTAYSSVDGILYNKNQSAIVRAPAGIIGAVTIPANVTSIGESAFSGCTGLTSVTIENGVTGIGDFAFDGCTGLTEITIPESVTSIGGFAFYGCIGLTSITIPESVTSIKILTFYGCTSLTEITIPESVTSIQEGAFIGCAGLKAINVAADNTAYSSVDGILYDKAQSAIVLVPAGITGAVTIPESVTSIGESAFSGCTGLTSVTIGNGVTSIGYGAFSGCTGLAEITIPESVTSIGNYAFYSCTGLTSITIPESVEFINGDTFSGCTDLTSVTIENGVAGIGDRAFSGCTGLTSITIPESVKSMNRSTFSGCTGLKVINVDANNTTYSSVDGIVYNKNQSAIVVVPAGITGSVTIPSSVTSIENLTFSGCIGLKAINVDANNTTYSSVDGIVYNKNQSEIFLVPAGITGTVTIPESVTSIKDYAFYGCSLTSVTIPASVTSIGTYAFSGCTGLVSVTNLKNTPISITSNVFQNVKIADIPDRKSVV
jgi:M6 family metalloprotease-like protein